MGFAILAVTARAFFVEEILNIPPLDSLASALYPSSMPKLTPSEIKNALRAVPNWKQRGKLISRTVEFEDFPAAIRFVHAVARLAEKAWHHPDIDIRWNKVVLTLTTHDKGGLTDKDFALAEKFDRLA